MFCHIRVISEMFHIWMFILLYIFGKWLILLSEIISWEEDASWLWASSRYHFFSFHYPVIYMRMILIHFLNHCHNRCLIITIMSTFCQNMGTWIYIPFVGTINIDITVAFRCHLVPQAFCDFDSYEFKSTLKLLRCFKNR